MTGWSVGPRERCITEPCPSRFERELLNLQLAAEDTWTRVALATGRPGVIIHDRGCLDIKVGRPLALLRT